MERKRNLPNLTQAEHDVMKVLWKDGQLSAREIHDRIADRNGWAYSTTRTILERMVQKDFLIKKLFHGIHIYSTRISRVVGLAKMVKDFASHVLELDHAPVVSLFAESEALTTEEIEELRELLENDLGKRRRS